MNRDDRPDTHGWPRGGLRETRHRLESPTCASTTSSSSSMRRGKTGSPWTARPERGLLPIRAGEPRRTRPTWGVPSSSGHVQAGPGASEARCLSSMALCLLEPVTQMRVAYLVLAHANPRHFAHLIGAVETSRSRVFAHIDAKSDLRPFAQSSIPRGFVRFSTNRVDARWGGFSLFQASLNLLTDALQGHDQFDYFVLLSGADYPLRSAQYIEAFLEEHSGMQFMNLVKLPCLELNKPMSRLTTYRFEHSSQSGGLTLANVGKLLNRCHLMPTITRDPE